MPKTILILTRREYHIQLMDTIQQILTRKPQMQKNHSLRLCSQLALSPRPPRLRVRPSAPLALGFEPFAFGPRPSAYPLDQRLAALRRPASGSLILMTPQLGNGNSDKGKPQAPRRPSASTPASVRRRPPPVIIRTVQQHLVVATAC